jgi:hypothetical protein
MALSTSFSSSRATLSPAMEGGEEDEGPSQLLSFTATWSDDPHFDVDDGLLDTPVSQIVKRSRLKGARDSLQLLRIRFGQGQG